MTDYLHITSCPGKADPCIPPRLEGRWPYNPMASKWNRRCTMLHQYRKIHTIKTFSCQILLSAMNETLTYFWSVCGEMLHFTKAVSVRWLVFLFSLATDEKHQYSYLQASGTVQGSPEHSSSEAGWFEPFSWDVCACCVPTTAPTIIAITAATPRATNRSCFLLSILSNTAPT